MYRRRGRLGGIEARHPGPPGPPPDPSWAGTPRPHPAPHRPRPPSRAREADRPARRGRRPYPRSHLLQTIIADLPSRTCPDRFDCHARTAGWIGPSSGRHPGGSPGGPRRAPGVGSCLTSLGVSPRWAQKPANIYHPGALFCQPRGHLLPPIRRDIRGDWPDPSARSGEAIDPEWWRQGSWETTAPRDGRHTSSRRGRRELGANLGGQLANLLDHLEDPIYRSLGFS